MTAKSLFNIILKVLGIYFIKDIIIAIPSLFAILYEFGNSDYSGAFSSLLLSLITLFIYSLIIYYLVFKTDWVIDRLNLLEKLPEDPIPLNIHRSTVLNIAVIIVGLILIVQNIPLLVRGLTQWYQYNKAGGGIFNATKSFDYSMIMVYVALIVIGLLFIGNQRTIVNFIELRQRKKDNEPGL